MQHHHQHNPSLTFPKDPLHHPHPNPLPLSFCVVAYGLLVYLSLFLHHLEHVRSPCLVIHENLILLLYVHTLGTHLLFLYAAYFS